MKYILNSETGDLYVRLDSHVVTDLPPPIKLDRYTPIHTDEYRNVIIAPSNIEVIDITDHIDIQGYGRFKASQLSFSTDLPVVQKEYDGLKLLSGNIPDNGITDDLLQKYICQGENDYHIPPDEKYLHLDKLKEDYYPREIDINEYELCVKMGVSYYTHSYGYGCLSLEKLYIV